MVVYSIMGQVKHLILALEQHVISVSVRQRLKHAAQMSKQVHTVVSAGRSKGKLGECL